MDPSSRTWSSTLRPLDANGEIIVKYLRPNKYGVQVVPPPGQAGIRRPRSRERRRSTPGSARRSRRSSSSSARRSGTRSTGSSSRDGSARRDRGPGSEDDRHGTGPQGPPVPSAGHHVLHGAPPSTSRCLIGLNALETGTGDAVWIGRCADEGFFPRSRTCRPERTSSSSGISSSTTSSRSTPSSRPRPAGSWTSDHRGADVVRRAGALRLQRPRTRTARRDPGEEGLFDVPVNLRFRDGTIYQSFPTDLTGFVPFEEVFPFFRWQIAEVDFARRKATGVTVVVDDGGEVTDDEFGEGKRTPSRRRSTGATTPT